MVSFFLLIVSLTFLCRHIVKWLVVAIKVDEKNVIVEEYEKETEELKLMMRGTQTIPTLSSSHHQNISKAHAWPPRVLQTHPLLLVAPQLLLLPSSSSFVWILCYPLKMNGTMRMGLFYFLFFTPLNYSPYFNLLVSIIIVSRFVRVFPFREYL